jgi:hypothetical protein
MFSVTIPVRAFITKPEPTILAFGFDNAINFKIAFVKIKVHFSLFFYDFGNSYLVL